MIMVNAITSWCDVTASEPFDRRVLQQLNVPVRNLRRSIDFYARVFGFHLRAIEYDNLRHILAIMSSTALAADLLLHERCDSGSPQLRRWAFTVMNLDRVRERVWDLGVSVARTSGEPDQIYRWSAGRSLYINDPDANEIELFEVCTLEWSKHTDLIAASAGPETLEFPRRRRVGISSS
jgi:catechol 2,3-dioxygenase-like lactoylglutathione lyase family enzyme